MAGSEHFRIQKSPCLRGIHFSCCPKTKSPTVKPCGKIGELSRHQLLREAKTQNDEDHTGLSLLHRSPAEPFILNSDDCPFAHLVKMSCRLENLVKPSHNPLMVSRAAASLNSVHCRLRDAAEENSELASLASSTKLVYRPLASLAFPSKQVREKEPKTS